MDVLGLDVGGANLKAADNRGNARSQPFALWKDPAGLPAALHRLLEGWPSFEQLAVTMTGELCDCFESKRLGVRAILDAVQAVAGAVPIRVWRNDGRFVDVVAARDTALQVASANWLALATWTGRLALTGPALLLDIGSTTTDIVPLLDGRPIPCGRTDPERLRSHELVYTGVGRTPLCTFSRGEVASELFATTLDMFLVLGMVPEDPTDTDTADGRPATHSAAHARLARMLCADLETSTVEERLKLARHTLLRQVHQLIFPVEHIAARLPKPPQTVILSGSGEFLIKRVLEQQEAFPPCQAVCLSQLLGPTVSRAGCAHAVAVLAAETRQGGE